MDEASIVTMTTTFAHTPHRHCQTPLRGSDRSRGVRTLCSSARLRLQTIEFEELETRLWNRQHRWEGGEGFTFVPVLSA